MAFSKSDLCASLKWVKPASEEEKGTFRLRFFKKGAEGIAIDPGHPVAVKLWMPSMGHGSSPVKVAPLKSSTGSTLPGEYEVSEVYFVMPGAWEIWVQLKQGSKVLDQAKIEIKL